MEKEIEIMPFMQKEQAKRDIEKGMVNSSSRDLINYHILSEVELQRRKANNIQEKRQIFNETNNVSTNNNKHTISRITKYTLAALAVGGFIMLYKESTYENKPIKYVVNEMALDSRLELSDNGKVFSGKMTQEELVDYAIKHELTIEQIEEEIQNYSRKTHLDNEFVEEKMEESNPEIFKRL